MNSDPAENIGIKGRLGFLSTEFILGQLHFRHGTLDVPGWSAHKLSVTVCPTDIAPTSLPNISN